MIHAVIMAGGIGTRFWPLSRKKAPKQVLDLMGKGPILEAKDLGLEGEGEHTDKTVKQKRESIIFPALQSTGIDLASTQESLERYYLKEALKITGGNESQAAKLLNMNHHTFRYRRKKLQVE